jgi:enoyl-[acyl-carrier protein] reductase I
MGFLAGKRALIVGVATDRSIAWGIAQAMHREGAELAFTYPNDRMKERVVPLAESVGSKLTMPLDVTVDDQIGASFDLLKREWGQLDTLIHAVAFAPGEALKGSFVENTSREAFRIAHDVSSYSFTALARGAAPLMAGRQGALLTLSYLGAVKSIPSYNVMGLAKGEPRSQRALHGRGPGTAGHSRQWYFGRTGENPRGRGHHRIPQNVESGRGSGADAPERDARGCGQRGGVPVLGSGCRHYR